MRHILLLAALLLVPLAAWLTWAGSERVEKTVSRPVAPARSAPTESELPERAQAQALPAVAAEGPSPDSDDDTAAGHGTTAETPVESPEDRPSPLETARRVRLPVILALRGDHPTPRARREAMLDALRRSGPSDEAWTKQAVPVFEDWTRGLSSDIGHRLDWSSARCFQAGCEVELSFPDRASYERAAREFRTLREEGAAHGGRVQTPAIDAPNGEVRASWILMRPDDWAS